MVAPPTMAKPPRQTAYIVAVAVLAFFAVLFGVASVLLYSDLAHISSCDGGLAVSSCPAPGGFGVEQSERGALVNGTWTYRFILFPVGVYQVNSSALSMTFHTDTGANVTPGGVMVYSLQSEPVVSYIPTGIAWTAAQPVLVNLPSVLSLSSSASLLNDSMTIYYSAGETISVGIY